MELIRWKKPTQRGEALGTDMTGRQDGNLPITRKSSLNHDTSNTILDVSKISRSTGEGIMIWCERSIHQRLPLGKQ